MGLQQHLNRSLFAHSLKERRVQNWIGADLNYAKKESKMLTAVVSI